MEIEIYNMDCVEGARKYIRDNEIDLLIADPPFGIQADKYDNIYSRKKEHVIQGYQEVNPEDYYEFTLRWIKEAERILRPGGSLYLISGWSNLKDVLNALDKTNLELINHLIWKYNFGVWTTRKYITSHYHILYLSKPGGERTFNTYIRYIKEDRDKNNRSLNYKDREDVWIINREYHRGKRKNSNKLPTELIKKMLLYSSKDGDTICDFFLGNFTTIYAAIETNRSYRIYGFEINKEIYNYHSHIIKQLLQIK